MIDVEHEMEHLTFHMHMNIGDLLKEIKLKKQKRIQKVNVLNAEEKVTGLQNVMPKHM